MSSQAGQVGIYGYTAYSASKLGLRGLVKALQQEVIADNIHIWLIFPPDTDIPGLEEENKRRPQLTSIISESSGAMKAEDVAKKALNGIKNRSFMVPCNFEGFLLSIAIASLSPQRSFAMAFVEVVSIGLVPFAALFFQWNWYGSGMLNRSSKYTKLRLILIYRSLLNCFHPSIAETLLLLLVHYSNL